MSDLDEFLNTYAGPTGTQPSREVHRFDLDPQDGAPSPFLVITAGPFTMVVSPMFVAAGTEDAHISLDVHPFVDGSEACVGVLGMAGNRSYRLGDPEPERTSHGWPAVSLVAVLLGRQA